MKEKILFILLGFVIVFVYAQGDAAVGQSNVDQSAVPNAKQPADVAKNFADEDNPGYVSKLIDFNILSEGSRFDEPIHIENWSLKLDSAIDYVYNKQLTYVKVARDKSGKGSMGIRVNFPIVTIDSYATLKPVLKIPFLKEYYQEKGYLENVGIIRFIRMRVNSNIFPYRMILVLVDKEGVKTSYRFNRKLNFYGWQTLVWENKSYEKKYRYNPNMDQVPVYPRVLPGVRLDSIKIMRENYEKLIGVFNKEGTDFIAYIGDIELVYDKAVSDELLDSVERKARPDYVDNEKIWNIETGKKDGFISKTYTNAFKKYKISERLQRARKNLNTPGFKLLK